MAQRGEKGRFQLFGDTVNVAARMESNGQGGRIQVSQTTADLLTAAGKSAWLTPREDKILAKGKGLMSTFWLTVKAEGSAVSTTDSMDSVYDQGVLENCFAQQMAAQIQEEAPTEQAVVDGWDKVSHVTEC